MATDSFSASPADLEFVLHEFDAGREGLRRCVDQINLASKGELVDIERLRAHSSRLLEQFDTIDALFELLRIELNPGGLDLLSTKEQSVHSMFYRACMHYGHRMKKKDIVHSLTKARLEISAYPNLQIVPLLLMDNAVKYSPKNSSIAIAIDESSRRVILSSTGPLICEDEKLTIFDRGVRGRNAIASSIGGQGIGLYLIKKVCDLHGFRLSFRQDQPTNFGGIEFCRTRFILEFTS